MSELEPKSSAEHLNPHELERLAENLTKPEAPSAVESHQSQQEQLTEARAKIERHHEQPAFIEKPAPEPKAQHRYLDKLTAYRQTLTSMQARLTPASRRFSRLIHQPVVEKASEVVGSTILRPSVALGATLTAVLVESLVYFTARYYGFALSGSELLLLLVAGAVIGLAVEAAAKLLHRRKLR